MLEKYEYNIGILQRKMNKLLAVVDRRMCMVEVQLLCCENKEVGMITFDQTKGDQKMDVALFRPFECP